MWYAQKGEDRKLRELLGERDPGFYIDVGAWEPTLDSVTKHFYDRGWHGINIEPVPFYHEKLVAERSRDINLLMAAGDANKKHQFAYIEGTGLSTFNEENIKLGSDNRTVHRIPVLVRTLSVICAAHVPLGPNARPIPIDFLKIDVEGYEREVILGMDFGYYRPKVLVIEATIPGTETPAWDTWDDLVLERGYEFLEFDSLNRWYLRKEV